MKNVDTLYTPVMKWLLRLLTIPYIASCVLVISYVDTWENISNALISGCFVFLWAGADIPPLMRAFNKRYRISIDIGRRSPLEFFGTYAYSKIRHQRYVKKMHSYFTGHYVYVIKDASASGYYKIGRTNEPRRRIGRFEIVLPFTIHIMFIIPCENDAALETALHRRFAKQRINGEWFKLQPKDLCWFIDSFGLEL